MAIDSTRQAAVTATPRPRIRPSFSFGTSRIPSAPTIGSIVVIVMAEFCQVIVPSLSFSRPDEDDGQRDHAGEKTDRVPLDLSGLDRPETPAEQLHRPPGAV